MERKNLSSTLKDHRIAITTMSSSNNNNSNNRSSFTNPESLNILNNNNNDKPKYPWSYNSKSYGEDYLSGFSWPPRSYTCSFCKREFRSAQALGGHMNVHRRDRARLRLSPPPKDSYNSHCHLLNLTTNANPNPSPNPNPSSSATSPALSALCATSHFNGSSSSKATNFDFMRSLKTRKSLFDSNEEVDNGRKLMKKGEVLRLDLEIGVSSNPKEDLDLELRLGYS